MHYQADSVENNKNHQPSDIVSVMQSQVLRNFIKEMYGCQKEELPF